MVGCGSPCRCLQRNSWPHPPPRRLQRTQDGHLCPSYQDDTLRDRRWTVSPYTLVPGDTFCRFIFPVVRSEDVPLVLAIGVYDPMTGKRWSTAAGTNSLSLELAP